LGEVAVYDYLADASRQTISKHFYLLRYESEKRGRTLSELKKIKPGDKVLVYHKEGKAFRDRCRGDAHREVVT